MAVVASAVVAALEVVGVASPAREGAVVAVVADVDPLAVELLPLPHLRVVPKVEERRLATSMNLRPLRLAISKTSKNLRPATSRTLRMSTPVTSRMLRLSRPASSLRNSSAAGAEAEAEVTPVATAGERLTM